MFIMELKSVDFFTFTIEAQSTHADYMKHIKGGKVATVTYYPQWHDRV